MSVTTAPRGYEGEGFPVRRAFAGVDLRLLDPFIHLDQMGEVDYAPGEPKGTPWHPHRGFETVTYMIDGVMDHQDSEGGGGTITDGDTQWMTAGSGLLHIEAPPEWLVVKGGLFHGLQLWVNLPARPEVGAAALPGPPLLPARPHHVRRRRRAGARHRRRGRRPDGSRFDVHADGDGARDRRARRRAGACRGTSTSTRSSTCCPATAPSGPTGARSAPGSSPCSAAATSCRCRRRHRQDSRHPALEVVVLGGRPIREPVAWGGPFVMNTKAEVLQAFEDFQKGRLGTVPAVHGLSNDVVES